MSKLVFSVLFSIISNKPTTTTEEFDAFHGFTLQNIKQTYKGGLHFTVICCTNKCIINERYIPEHQNCDLQNYDFFANFFQPKKNRKIR